MKHRLARAPLPHTCPSRDWQSKQGITSAEGKLFGSGSLPRGKGHSSCPLYYLPNPLCAAEKIYSEKINGSRGCERNPPRLPGSGEKANTSSPSPQSAGSTRKGLRAGLVPGTPSDGDSDSPWGAQDPLMGQWQEEGDTVAFSRAQHPKIMTVECCWQPLYPSSERPHFCASCAGLMPVLSCCAHAGGARSWAAHS